MGVSTDAFLFFGYCWSDETRLFDPDEDGELSEKILAERGEKNPWDAAPDVVKRTGITGEQRKQSEAWIAEHRLELDEWYGKKRAIEKTFEVDIGQHCSDGCTMPYVSLIASLTLARRGYPESLGQKLPDADPGWAAKIDAFMEKFKIEKPEGQTAPQWWLASWWG
jgi:hypothetical protein